ncbi:MAG: c-type cytochrome, partial [Verrucomicrobiota bacterium]
FITYALNQAVFALKPFWLEPFKSGKLNLENKPARLKFLIQADGTSDTLQVVRDSLKSPQLDLTTRETFLRALIDTGEPNDFAAVLKLTDADLQARLLPALTTAVRLRNARPNADLTALLKPLIESQQFETRSESLKLAGLWKVEPLRAVVENFALNAPEDEKVRRSAIEALAGFADDASRKTLGKLSSENTSVQSAALVALCSLDVTNAAQIFSETVSNVNDEAALTEIFSAFFQRQTGAEILAQVFGKRPPTKIAAEVGLRLMNSSGRRHEGLARILTEAAGLNLQNQRMTPAEIATFAGEVRTRGDAKHGAEIFRRAELGCAVCHAVNGQGGNLGPDLSALGSAQPVEFIIGAILDPQKEIKEGFLSISITMKDGEEYQGYLVRETADEIILRDVLQNKEVRLRRDAIQEKKQNGSVMPTGLADTLTRTEFRDLVRFLSELGKTK